MANTTHWLVGGPNHYMSHRLCFGLLYGPCGLQNSLGEIFIQLMKSPLISSYASLYVDDFFINGGIETLDSLNTFLSAMSLSAFECSINKFQAICQLQHQEALKGKFESPNICKSIGSSDLLQWRKYSLLMRPLQKISSGSN